MGRKQNQIEIRDPNEVYGSKRSMITHWERSVKLQAIRDKIHNIPLRILHERRHCTAMPEEVLKP
jgi:hypothetical protein